MKYSIFGDGMKKSLMTVLLALLIGGGLAYYFLSDIRNDIKNETSKANAFQVGVFSKYENAIKKADETNGIVVNDNDLYRVYVAITTNSETTNKLSIYYNEQGINYYLKEININSSLSKKISEYESNLNKENYTNINQEILKEYQEENI